MKSPAQFTIEPLEARIAPALTVLHPIPDLIPGIAKTGATLDLAKAFDAAGSFRTHVRFTTNYIDPAAPGVPQIIELELFDDKAPLTVANFLRYVNNLAPSDYDGVFFHRSIPGFVLQGGGFATDAPGTHIAVDAEVHNEFNATDSERSNLIGTVAMAKTGLGPHTATSEWFVNLADNSGNLDLQNGGFTVFAKVTQGMNVVNAIAALNRSNLSSLNGALTDLPLQNYNADPDSNAATPPPTPTAAQFITITDAAVIAPTPATAAGVTYTLASITDATTLAATNIVTGTISGQNLQLQYTAGATGVAKVTIKASQAGEADVFEEFLVTLKSNLIATTSNNPFATTLVPGDKANVSVQLTNSGAALTSGNYDITFYLSKIGATDTLGTIVQPGVDAVIGTIANQSLNLASGAKTTLTTEVTITQKLLQTQGESYRVIAEVKPSAGATGNELFADDNVTLNSGQHSIFNAFGTFAGRTNVALTYADSANTIVTAALTGGGYGQFDPQGAGTLDRLAIFQTTAASALTMTAGSPTVLDALYIDAAIGSADLSPVTVKTSFDAHRGIKTLLLGDVGDGVATRPFSIGAFAADATQKATVTLGQVRDVEFTSAMPIAALQATRWLDGDAEADIISVPAIDSLVLAGDSLVNGAFQADLTITGNSTLPLFRIAYFDPANQFTILTITGGGYAHFTPARNGATGPLEVLGTSAASTLSLVAGSATTIDSIDITTVIDSAVLGEVTVKGDFQARAGLKTLTLGGIGDGAATNTLAIGAFAADPSQKVTLSLGHVRDVMLTSAMPVATLTAIEWRSTDGTAELIAAPGINTLSITGDATHSGIFNAFTGLVPLALFKLAYLDAANQPVTLTITGGGYGRFDPQRDGSVGKLEIQNTTTLSSLELVTASDVGTTLDSILIGTAIGHAKLGNLTLKGNFTVAGSINTLTLGNVGDGTVTRVIYISGNSDTPSAKTTISLGSVRDVTLATGMPIGALTAIDWLDSNPTSGNEGISAPAIDSIYIKGDATLRGNFQADLTITGTTKLQSFIATGTVSTARLQIAGDVGLIRLGALVRSEILVGVTSLPRTLADFAANNHRIDTFKILNGGAASTPLIDSQIAAARIGTISVGKVAPASGDSRFGFIADRINNYLVGGKTAFNLTAPMIFDQRTHYAVKIV